MQRKRERECASGYTALVLYTADKWIAAQLDVIAVTGVRTPVPRVTYSALTPNPDMITAPYLYIVCVYIYIYTMSMIYI